MEEGRLILIDMVAGVVFGGRLREGNMNGLF
jgi:hypothetical protein